MMKIEIEEKEFKKLIETIELLKHVVVRLDKEVRCTRADILILEDKINGE